MKLLLTGGLGYIGSHTAVEFLNLGHEIVAFDNLSNTTQDVKAAIIEAVRQGNISEESSPCLTFIKGDLLNVDDLNKTFTEHKFDAVVHFAGLKAVGESVQKPLWYYENNVTGTINLLNTMIKHDVKKIVFSSSATVYGDPQELPIFETTPLNKTTNPYGETKAMIERILSDLCIADKDFTVVTLRYFNPIGAHESGLIGERPNGIPNNLAPYIAQVANGTREYLNVFGDDYDTIDGTGVRDYIHVTDLALGHVAAVDRLRQDNISSEKFPCLSTGFHVFNLGTGNGTSVFELLRSYEKAVGHEIPYKVMPRRAGDISTCYASADKAREILGWTATRTIDEMCLSMVKFNSK